MRSRERRVPEEIRAASQKSEAIDFQKKKTERARETTPRQGGQAPQRGLEKTLSEEEREQRAQIDRLSDQLRFLTKRLDVSQDTLRDPDAVQQLDKSYREILNQMNKAVVKYDNAIKPLRSEIKMESKTVGQMQKKYEKSSGIAKFIRGIFPALDSAGRELVDMRTALEKNKKKLDTQEQKRNKASNAGQEYTDLLNTLAQAEGVIHQLDSIIKKSA